VTGDVVITRSLIARAALAVLGDINARGMSFHMIDLGGDVISHSKLVFTLLPGVAEASGTALGRVSQVNADQKERGRYLESNMTFGFTVDRRTEEQRRPLTEISNRKP
jgi:putative DNA-invertase from lambdoid prophage Rac